MRHPAHRVHFTYHPALQWRHRRSAMCATMRSGSSAACSESSLRRPAQVGLPGQAGLARNACTAAVAALSTLLHIATDPAELPCTPDSGAPAVPAGGAARMPLLHVEGGHQRAAARGRGVAAGGGGGDQGGARACGGTGGARGGVGSGGVGCKCWAVVLMRWCARHCVAVSCVLCCMVWWWRTAACIWCIPAGGGQLVRAGQRRAGGRRGAPGRWPAGAHGESEGSVLL